MPSLLSDAEKTSVNAILRDLHDTFAQDIVLYTEIREEIVDDSDYNPLYGRKKNNGQSSSSISFAKETVQARVAYVNDQTDLPDALSNQSNISISKGIVRLKIKEDIFEKIKNAAKIEIDDRLFSLISDAQIAGPFGSEFFIVFLQREG